MFSMIIVSDQAQKPLSLDLF